MAISKFMVTPERLHKAMVAIGLMTEDEFVEQVEVVVEKEGYFYIHVGQEDHPLSKPRT